ncbi:hypothetical protein BEP19_13930 [Ammoniphilus oxalaticus]|uniref:DUF86 domain-containing protein n=1 Tax=Ammoniphilus oxalaticus TaxID=66863 RepID=A0A419SET0_9BACL|nr:HepT-like ribonuclease domain-containing protein [Ammoniphilus oxalaticus]RKD21724.1 hypothetical protein BEP19_13930 [Ammoniphilus oxalaticus]
MYKVDTEKINNILTYMTDCIFPTMRQTMSTSQEQFLADETAGFAAERLFHLFIEGMTDIGNTLIDGFIMRDPGGYDDIVDIMEDERVYAAEEARIFKQIIYLRKNLVVEYIDNHREQLYSSYHQSLAVIERYPEIIRTYLAKELW